MKPPSGDSILHICGGWLFEAINHYQKGFDDGKVAALDTICSLFTSRPANQFQPEYLAHFYRGIEKALNTSNSNLLSVILRNSITLFQNEYRGSHVLIPAYIIAIERVLFSNVCFSSLSLLPRFPSHFSFLPFPSSFFLLFLSLPFCLCFLLPSPSLPSCIFLSHFFSSFNSLIFT